VSLPLNLLYFSRPGPCLRTPPAAAHNYGSFLASSCYSPQQSITSFFSPFPGPSTQARHPVFTPPAERRWKLKTSRYPSPLYSGFELCAGNPSGRPLNPPRTVQNNAMSLSQRTDSVGPPLQLSLRENFSTRLSRARFLQETSPFTDVRTPSINQSIRITNATFEGLTTEFRRSPAIISSLKMSIHRHSYCLNRQSFPSFRPSTSLYPSAVSKTTSKHLVSLFKFRPSALGPTPGIPRVRQTGLPSTFTKSRPPTWLNQT